MGFKEFFSNNFETKENHHIQSLRTRYYRNRLDDVRKVVYNLIEEEGGKLISDNKKFNEILFETSKYSLIVILVETKINEVAIDLAITTKFIFPRGRGQKIIERLYQTFDKKLNYKGVSLY
jgi:hypothetical protein